MTGPFRLFFVSLPPETEAHAPIPKLPIENAPLSPLLLGAESHRLRTALLFLGAESHHLGTVLLFLGAESHRLGTVLLFFKVMGSPPRDSLPFFQEASICRSVGMISRDMIRNESSINPIS